MTTPPRPVAVSAVTGEGITALLAQVAALVDSSITVDFAPIAVPPRVDPSDVLVARDGLTLVTLPEGARVGTSAPRRISQLKAMRPDLDIRPLRGNIESRMGRVTSGELDAIVLAYAGLSRAGYGDRATQLFDATTFLPAPAQGALAVECRSDDAATRAVLDPLMDTTAALRISAERHVLATLEAGCTAPVAAHAAYDDGVLTLRAGVFALDGSYGTALAAHDERVRRRTA